MSQRIAILGGCGGIGRDLVAALRADGTTPIVLDLSASIEAHPMDVETHTVDATDADAMLRVADEAGEIGGFVNLCGFMSDAEPLATHTPETWASLIDGNLTSAFYAARAFSSHIIDGGAMVLTGSGLGHFARPGYGAYAVAKAGIAAITRQLALELAPNCRVNCVAPSAVDTAFLRGGTGRSDEQQAERLDREAYAKTIPLGRIAKPRDITGPIQFLLSPASDYITGQVLHVNGGTYMG
jgi:3-oxoacyl-[acyl-carrier protein] reductase